MFQFELCRELGYPHPDVMLDELTAGEMEEWEAFDRVSPIGGRRWDFYFSFLMMSIYNLTISVHGKKGAKQYEFEDFYPKWAGEYKEEEEQKEPMSIEDMKKFWVDFADRHNKQVKVEKLADKRKPRNK